MILWLLIVMMTVMFNLYAHANSLREEMVDRVLYVNDKQVRYDGDLDYPENKI